MATVTFGGANAPISMTDGGLVDFDQENGVATTAWSWFSTDGGRVDIDGLGLVFDPQHHATDGRVTRVRIDTSPVLQGSHDVEITGLDVDATLLDDSPTAFWNAVLAGNDTIDASGLTANLGNANFIFGDDLFAGTGLPSRDRTTNHGGNDTITFGGAGLNAVGDVANIVAFGGTAVAYQGGNDTLQSGAITSEQQRIVGDADSVGANSRIVGGDDQIQIVNSNAASEAIGDVAFANGSATQGRTEVIGGNDVIASNNLEGQAASLTGDVSQMGEQVSVTGGDDLINGGLADEHIAGDVRAIVSGSGTSVTGGDDFLSGFGGDDVLAGDVSFAAAGATIAGGADTIRGGFGSDTIFGEVADGAGAVLSGGNDSLFGNADDDVLFGQTGDDRLDGGAGADVIDGGSGFDFATYDDITAVTADLLDISANQGDASGDTYVSIEGLIGSFVGDDLRASDGANTVFAAQGDDVVLGRGGRDKLFGEAGSDQLDGGEAGDKLSGGDGNDQLDGGDGGDRLSGEAGKDRLDGGAGSDVLDGGAGSDTVSYAFADAGVRVDLAIAAENAGEAANDTLVSIEGLIGSSFADTLRGSDLANTLSGRGGADRLEGRGGADLLTGGGGEDTFVFAAGSGQDRVLDFENGLDRLDLRDLDFSSFAEVKALASDTAGGDLQLAFGNGDVLILDDFGLANFTAGDVLL